MALPAFDASLPFEEQEDSTESLPSFDPSLPFEEDVQTKPTRVISKPAPVGTPTAKVKPKQTEQEIPVRGSTVGSKSVWEPQGETQALTDEQSNQATQYENDIWAVAKRKGSRTQKLAILKKLHPNLDPKEVGDALTYYEQGGQSHLGWYINEEDANPVLTVTGVKGGGQNRPNLGPQGAIYDSITDGVKGTLEGVQNSTVKPAISWLDKGAKAVGLVDPNNSDVAEAFDLVTNQDEKDYVSPDGVARTGGELVGNLLPYVLASELKPITALAPEGGALATSGNLAAQGGLIGAAQSDGEDIVGDTLKNAFLTAAFGGLGGEGTGALKRAAGKEGYAAPEPKLTAKDFTDAPDDGLKRFLGKEDVVDPISPEPHVSDEVLERLTQALKNAGGVKEEQAAMFKKQRAERFAAAKSALANGSGVDAFHQAKSQLKGALDAPAFEGIGEQFSQIDKDALAKRIADTPTLTMTGKFSAFEGLKKVMRGDIPAAKELEHLSEAFPADFLKEVIANRSNLAKSGGVFAEVWNLPKSLMSSVDLSAPLRQGVGLVTRAEFRDASKEMIHYVASKQHFDELVDSIKRHPDYALAEEGGLSLTVAGDNLGAREDIFSSHLGEKIPGVGAIVRGSERGYVGFLNKLRFDTFVNMVDQAEKAGLDIRNDPKALKGLSNFINVMTGRGGLGKFEGAVQGLNLVFFSPRLISSRLQILTAPLLAPLGKGFIGELPKELQMEAVKSYAGMVAYYTTAIGLASAVGYTVSANPLSSDFGKIRDGNTRVDLGGGLLQYITAGARAVMRVSTSTTSGSTRELKRTGDTPLDNDLGFIINKLHPTLSLLVDQQRGKNAVGEKFEWESAILQRLTPMGLPDIYGTLKEHPNANGVLYATLGLLGAGLQNYPSKDSERASESGLPSFDPSGTFEEVPEKNTEDVKEDKPESTLPSFDRNKPFDVSTEDNITATSVIRGLGLHTTDTGIRSRQRQAKYYRTTKGAAPPGYGAHEEGDAVDIRVPRDGTKPSQVVSGLEQAGFYGVSIITRTHGTGPHWHVQWKGRKTE